MILNQPAHVFSLGYFLIIFTVGYLQSLHGCYIMERFFIKVNEDIETHIAAERETTFINLTDKKIWFLL